MARRRFLYQGDPPAIVLRDERAATCADEDAERRSEKEYGHRRRSFFPREIVRDHRMSRRQANRLAYAHAPSCQHELRKIVRETDRKSVVEGKSVVIRVHPGGLRILQKKTKQKIKN